MISIYVEDVDSNKEALQQMNGIKPEGNESERISIQYNSQHNDGNEECGKYYTKEAIQEAIEKVLEEMQRRKHEFCKLIDEHDAVIEHLKRIERESSHCNISSQHSPIMT